jgi:pimeloyl-ACP methyl ester carboxylesterase
MTRQATQVDEKTLKVPRATLYYEVRGSGPVLLCIPGGPADAGMFTDLANRLADRYTVVGYDPRGHSRSTLDGEPEDISVSAHGGWASDSQEFAERLHEVLQDA